jgi:hypothetical protein
MTWFTFMAEFEIINKGASSLISKVRLQFPLLNSGKRVVSRISSPSGVQNERIGAVVKVFFKVLKDKRHSKVKFHGAPFQVNQVSGITMLE